MVVDRGVTFAMIVVPIAPILDDPDTVIPDDPSLPGFQQEKPFLCGQFAGKTCLVATDRPSMRPPFLATGWVRMPISRAWAVHLLTAGGAALALFAALSAALHAWQTAYLLLGVALVVDGIDGPLARAVDVSNRLPWIDGRILDLVVDYTTYVFVPALIVVDGPLLTAPYAAIAAVVVIVAGALYFADTRMKTSEEAFRGFPAVWNVVVFQLMVYKLPALASLFVLAVCAVLTFTPVEFVHPVRVRRWRPLTLTMAAMWALLGGIALLADLNPPPVVVVALAVVSLYFAAVGAVQQLVRRLR
jgi:phosphatidylcholine synthase